MHRLYQRVFSRTPTGVESLNATYDRQTVEVMRRVLRNDSNCIDVGAHSGELLQHMVAIAPGGTHHAFEALPHMAAELRRRFPAVCIHQFAVSDRSGESDFQFVENAPGYSGLRRRIYDRTDPHISTIRVQAITIDDAIPAYQPVAFMKLDIEGGEYHALKGAIQTIRRWHPVIIFEAGQKSTGQYDVSAGELFDLVAMTIGNELSTMGRWLAGQTSMTREEFCSNWHNGPDFYFIATPASVSSE